MDYFHEREGALACEEVALERVAQEVGTPCYVYSYATLRRHFTVFEQALKQIPHLICFSVKANTNAAVLAVLGSLGSGADIVSGGELLRALRAGISAEKIVFSGVGKQPQEIQQALEAGILLFNVESEGELHVINEVAGQLGRRAPIALRVNPDVDPGTHPYIATGLRENKFGIPMDQVRGIIEQALQLPNLVLRGIDCHVGSQLTKVEPFVDSVRRIMTLAREMQSRGADLRYIDVGGGLGIRYSEETPPSPEEYGRAVGEVIERLGSLELCLIAEPGRVIVGNAGVLLTRVLYVKDSGSKRFVIVDAAMNDLIRPTLYGSFHRIRPVRVRPGEALQVDVVGPICESGDFLARDRALPPLVPGDLLCVLSAGAYGYTMTSNYNSRPRPAEVMVRGSKLAVVRPRESFDDLVRGETVPDWARQP